MASDEQQFNRSYEKWQGLQAAGNYSAPPDIGKLAILASYEDYYDWTDEANAREANILRTEAWTLGALAENHGRKVDVVYDATKTDYDAVLADETVSHIITIGHGSISGIELNRFTAHDEAKYSWRDVSAAADHLKTGSFVQRQCGSCLNRLPVPLGIFAVAEPAKVYAAVNRQISPDSLDHPDNSLIRPVFPDGKVSYHTVKALRTVPAGERTLADDRHDWGIL